MGLTEIIGNTLCCYNFPPYSVGEAGRMAGPGRREIGHGKLAWRALRALLPDKEDFPYTMRVVSEITESNGSSSHGNGLRYVTLADGCWCAPMPRPVAGIAWVLSRKTRAWLCSQISLVMKIT